LSGLILGAGLAGFVLLRSPRARGLAVGAMVFFGLGLLSTVTCVIWDGGFCRAEFRITFRDAQGRPVEGVELRVEDERGSEFFHYPVTDYLPGQVPAADADGTLVFHHATYSGLEFGGQSYYLFFVIPVGQHHGPTYVCRFLYRGREVYRVPYDDLNAEAWKGPTVRRRWRWPDWPYQVLQESYQITGDWHLTRLQLFDRNGNGVIEQEEGAAARAAEWAYGKTQEVQTGR